MIGAEQQLTIDRLFEAPALSGPIAASLKIAPDGSRIFYLQGKTADKDRLDLWQYDQQLRTSKLLIDAGELIASDRTLSDEESARRERQRKAALSGIVHYEVSPCWNWLIFQLDGEIYRRHCRDASGHAEKLPTEGSATDASISPQGRYVAYVLGENLFLFEIASQQTRQLTHDGCGVIKNGMAEFVAQEEMDRDTGYWWAPDDRHIAFARVDESQVIETQRFEISADNVKTFAQRYPAAGQSNVLIDIGVISVESGLTVWLDLGPDRDIYVARVHWLPDGQTLSVQRQTRDQKQLDLLFFDIATGRCRVVLTETSESWIDLHHELSFLQKSDEFIWASSRSGFSHLYLYRSNGQLIRQITQGDWNVDDFRSRAVKGIDEAGRRIYFVATAKSPLERQLYGIGLDSGDAWQITRDPGVHAVTLSADCRFFVDQFNSSTQPPRAELCEISGQLRHWILRNRLDENHPDAPYHAMNAVSEFGTLNAADGQKLYYRLYKPSYFDASERYPVVVDVYGGPGVQRVLDTWSGNAFVQILTRAGYVVMMLDNRGSAGRGVVFQAPIVGHLGQVEVADQLVGARWLASQRFVDPERIGVMGWSYGGYMTLMLLFTAPEVFRAGISGAPVTDWHLYDTHYTERFLGMPQKNSAGYSASSVISRAARMSSALLLMHGMADDNVLFLHSTKLIRKLQDAAQSFDLMLYPGAKHGLLRQNEGRHAYSTIMRFLAKNLGPLGAGQAGGRRDATISPR